MSDREKISQAKAEALDRSLTRWNEILDLVREAMSAQDVKTYFGNGDDMNLVAEQVTRKIITIFQ